VTWLWLLLWVWQGSSVRAWSAVPRPGQTLEWVRVGFKKAVAPTAVSVFETFNPGSVVCIRGAERAKGVQAEGSDWVVLWSGACEWAEDGAARAYQPPLRADTSGRLISVLEITLDTSEWGEAWWTELDAIQLTGEPPAAPAQSATAARGSGGGAAAGAAAAAAVDTWLPRMTWECDPHFASRARFERSAFGHTPPATEEEGMRRAALSMAHLNMSVLGCKYPAAVEEQVSAVAGGAKRSAASGMAVEGEMRAAAEARGIS